MTLDSITVNILYFECLSFILLSARKLTGQQCSTDQAVPSGDLAVPSGDQAVPSDKGAG